MFGHAAGVGGIGDEGHVQAEEVEGAKEEGGGGGGEDVEEGEEEGGQGEEWPAGVGRAAAVLFGGGREGLESVGAGKGGGESDAVDAVEGAGGEVRVAAGEGGDAAASVRVADDAGVDSGLADEAVAAVDGGRAGVVGVRSADDEALVDEGLVADCAGFVELGGGAIGLAAEG